MKWCIYNQHLIYSMFWIWEIVSWWHCMHLFQIFLMLFVPLWFISTDPCTKKFNNIPLFLLDFICTIICLKICFYVYYVYMFLLYQNVWILILLGTDKVKCIIWGFFFLQTIRWCTQKTNEMMFTRLAQTPIHSEASLSGCQYTRSSTITYNLTNQDTFTKFLCESGDTGLCGTGTAIQHVNITIGKLWELVFK